jgi:hypothetical protein
MGPTPTTDPATGMTIVSPGLPIPPGGTGCACDLKDPSCMCDASGNCSGRTCVGQCVPKQPTCDPARLVACPTTAQLCPNGLQPIQTGVNPMTCCPIYTCPVCARSTTLLDAPIACPAIDCRCAKQTGTDPMSCCPLYECGPVDANGVCLD